MDKLSHIHLNYFNANIDPRSLDTGWVAFFFLMGILFFFFLVSDLTKQDKIDHHKSAFYLLSMHKNAQLNAKWDQIKC